MARSTNDLGVITALLERFEKERYPRAMRLRAHIEAGNKLRDADIQFLEAVHEEVGNIESLIKRNPDFEPLVTKAMNLYKEIALKAAENEGKP